MIHFVTALECEARPLIERFDLKRIAEVEPYRIYRGERATLVVSGIGKMAAASAVGFWNALNGAPQFSAWLNVGVAGHRDMEVGSGALAHKITDRASGRSWYPPRVFAAPCATMAVITVDGVERDFDAPALYEMEASGFYSAATRFTSAELAQCFKVVSDNRAGGTEKITADSISEAIGKNLEAIEKIAAELQSLGQELGEVHRPPAEYEDCLNRWHFTATERQQLRNQLRRLEVRSDIGAIDALDLTGCDRGKAVLARIDAHLNGLPVRLETESVS